ncbi:MAG: hypothetical protein LBP87_05600 [Planctomycetaceae bacterium]|jgi:hypothetical protein|nr:hypothetical protein [Planctomycetaceae bacterium]
MTNFINRTNIVTVNEINFADYNKLNEGGKSGILKNFYKFSKINKIFSEFRGQDSWKNCWKIISGILFTFFILLIFLLTCCGFSSRLLAEEPLWHEADHFSWETDFAVASQKAKEQSKNLLIYFYAEKDSLLIPNSTEERFVKVGKDEIRQVVYVLPQLQKPLPITAACREFEDRIFNKSSSRSEVFDLFNNYILLKLPIDAVQESGVEGQTPILDLPQFREMAHLPGLAMIDYEHKEALYYENIVGILPFLRAKPPTLEQVQTFLTLPPGTLTQRTLIYALRTHPERPLSTMGIFHPSITKEATDHSTYQAKTRVLGHQNFGTRSSRISEKLEQGSVSEICAQSWTDEGLFEAAIGCVRAWRNSSGHWSAARKKHTYYGYDMVLGSDNIWYATGIFVD